MVHDLAVIRAEALDDGQRVLVFSQFVSMLALLREALDAAGIAASIRARIAEKAAAQPK